MKSSAENLQTTAQKVEQILKISPEARENDTVLYLQFLVLHHGLQKELGSKLDTLTKIMVAAPSPETVRRSRQKLQEQGKFPPCDPKRRRQLANDFVVELNKLDS